MKIQNLREFILLSNIKNYNLAAEKLFISQPTLSRHIKELEDELDVVLLDRSTRKVTLTEYGIYFLPFAKRIVAEENSYLYGLSEMKKAEMRTIYLGVVSEVNQDVEDLITQYNVKNPDAIIKTCNGESEDLKAELKNGHLDFIFIREGAEKDSSLSHIPLSSTTLKVLMPNSHPLAGKDPLHIEELKKEPFLMNESTSLAYKDGMELAAAHGFEPEVVFQGNKSQVINLVRRGMGISLMYMDLGGIEYPDLVITTLAPIRKAEINCVYQRDRMQMKGQGKHESFLRFIEENAIP